VKFSPPHFIVVVDAFLELLTPSSNFFQPSSICLCLIAATHITSWQPFKVDLSPHTLSITHTGTYTQTHTLSLSLSHPHEQARTNTHILYLSDTHKHTLTHPLSLSLSLRHTYSLSHTNTHTHVRSSAHARIFWAFSRTWQLLNSKP